MELNQELRRKTRRKTCTCAVLNWWIISITGCWKKKSDFSDELHCLLWNCEVVDTRDMATESRECEAVAINQTETSPEETQKLQTSSCPCPQEKPKREARRL